MMSMAVKNVDSSFQAVEQGPGEDGIKEIEDREEEIDLANVRLSKKYPVYWFWIRRLRT